MLENILTIAYYIVYVLIFRVLWNFIWSLFTIPVNLSEDMEEVLTIIYVMPYLIITVPAFISARKTEEFINRHKN